MSHVGSIFVSLSYYMRHVPKMALVTFEDRPNFVGTLLKLWGNDSDHFWRFLGIFWENHRPVSKWCQGCHAGHRPSKIATDTYWCYIITLQKFFCEQQFYWAFYGHFKMSHLVPFLGNHLLQRTPLCMSNNETGQPYLHTEVFGAPRTTRAAH